MSLVRSAANARVRIPDSYGSLPLAFEANRGQVDSPVRFLSRGPGYTLFLAPDGATLSLRPKSEASVRPPAPDMPLAAVDRKPGAPAQIHMQLVRANRGTTIEGEDELPGKTNYFHGHDPKDWHTNINTFAKVRYRDVFDGIDLVYYGKQGQLEYDFVVAPGARPDGIRLAFTGLRRIYVDARSGDLVLKLRKGSDEIRFRLPVAYQQAADSPQETTSNRGRDFIPVHYVVARNQVTFQLGPYDHHRKLLIDPTLSYSTYLGGSSDDYGTSIAVDSTGAVYVAGYTNSASFPIISGSYQGMCGAGCSNSTVDAFITKLDPTGSFLVYSTYLGGSLNDYGNGIALDAAGDAYIVGQTYSTDFPTTPGAFQPACSTSSCSGGDVFVSQLDPTGSTLLYSTYLGGSSINQGNAIILDSSNNAYITGCTESTNFPTTPGAYQNKLAKGFDVFVTELNPQGSALVYSTYLGGAGKDVGYAIALDSLNNAYVTGYTQSNNFPTTTGAFQSTLGANTAAFVTELNSTGTALVYSTYLGGSTTATTPCETCGTSIAVDSNGSAYVAGLTAESNFPTTAGAYQTVFHSSPKGHDAFVTKFDPTGATTLWSTYLGGANDDGATGLALDSSGNVWIKGNTQSKDFPVSPGAYQTTFAGLFDAFVAEFDPTGSLLLYSSYLGGSGDEFGGATRMLAVDTQTPANVYVTGYTNSTNFPVIAGGFQSSSAGANDAFVSKFSPSPNVQLSPSSLSFGNQNDGSTSNPLNITVTNVGNTALNVSNISVNGTNLADFAETNTCTQVAPGATCTVSVTFTPSLVGSESATISITDDAANSPQSEPVSGMGVGLGSMVQLSASNLIFPLQVIGTSSAGQVVTLTNIGNAPLNITSLTSSGDFSQINTCGLQVAVQATCTITVTFTPTAINSRTGSITLVDDAPNSPQAITLTGTGTYISLAPNTLNFGTVSVGTSSAPQVVTLTNKDNATLAFRSISVTGIDRSDFSETNTCGSRITKGASCSITVTFAPTVAGIRNAAVSVTDLGGGSPQTVSLTGTGQ